MSETHGADDHHIHGIDSDFARLIANGQGDPTATRDKQVAALLAHARHTSRSMHEMTAAVSRLQNCMTEMASHVGTLQTEMAENTKITTVVRDTMTAGRVGTKVIKWIGVVAVSIGAVVGAAWTVINGTHGGDIGVGP